MISLPTMRFISTNLHQSIAFASLLFLISCSGEKEPATDNHTTEKIAVQLAKPIQDNQGMIEVSGKVEPAKTSVISTRFMGFITQISVNVGDRVEAGRLLVSLNAKDILAKKAQATAMLSEAEAALESAKKDYDRFKTLVEQNSATAKEMDNVTLQLQTVKARVEAARQMRNEADAMMQYTQLKAPFAGIVTAKNMQVGDVAGPGMPILMIEQSDKLQIGATVSETDIAKLSIGDEAKIEVKSLNKIFDGKIIEINTSSQTTGGQYPVKISITGAVKPLYSGMYVSVNILKKAASTAESSIWVEEKSIIKKGQLTGLYTVSESGVAMLRWVTLGNSKGDKTEILSGISPDEHYVAQAEGALYNGASVSFSKK